MIPKNTLMTGFLPMMRTTSPTGTYGKEEHPCRTRPALGRSHRVCAELGHFVTTLAVKDLLSDAAWST